MRSALLFGVIALGSLAGSSFAQGQHAIPVTGHAAPSPTHAIPAKDSGSHGAANHHNSTSTGVGATHPSNSKPYPLDVYGVGAATMTPRIVRPVSPGGFGDPLAGTNKGRGQSKAPSQIIIFGGGYGYGYVPDDSQLQAQEQTQDQNDDQQSGGQQQSQYVSAQQGPDSRGQVQQGASEQTQFAEPVPVVPLRDVGSFTLVTSQGYHLDAVAFTRLNDRLVYITPDGGRRTIAFRDLDIDSTQRLNQELGTPVDLSPIDAPPPAKQNSTPPSEISN
jgi:hypothetical protein